MNKKRPIEIRGELGIVPLTKGYEALIDASDADDVGRYNWSAGTFQNGAIYALRHDRSRGGNVLLHREIMGPLSNMVVDHIDGNTLDNRRSNLRCAEWWQNIVNQKKSSRNTSGYRGVSLHQKSGRWCAQIKRGDRRVHLGYFDEKDDAARAYDAKATELFGAYAHLNFPNGEVSTVGYVRHGERAAHEAAGWVFVSDLGPTHGQWSVLMKWTGEGEPA